MNKVLSSKRAEPRDPLFIGSLDKGFRVLQAFREIDHPLSLSEISTLTGLGKSAVQRFCHTLVSLGYLEKDPKTKRFRPSVRLLDFSFMYLQANSFVQIASPFMLQAHESSHEAVNLAVPDNLDVVYVVRLPSLSSRLTSPRIGGRAPMFCTASGRCILSTYSDDEVGAILDRSALHPLTKMTITDRAAILKKIEETRHNGFAIAQQECIIGEISVAAPIIGNSRRAIGSVNFSVTTPKWNASSVRKKLAPMIAQTAMDISRAGGLSAVS
jgi:DNA-binding IclR family transcriptional regulator